MKAVVIVIFVILIVFLVSQVWYFYRETGSAEKELNMLKAKLSEAQRDYEDLNADYEFYSRPENLEKELRARFNYRSSDEKMIIIVPPQATSSAP